jgi:phosphate transport system ATP-binding protein
MPMLCAEEVCVRYGDRSAVENVCLNLYHGRVMALVGPSGCGKTTFLKSLNRLTDLIPRCTVQGKIALRGRDIAAASTDVVTLRRQVGMIFQRPSPFPMSIARNFELPLRAHGVARSQVGDAMESALRDVGLWEEVKDRLAGPACCLSGGQQQRLCIARAMALKPDVLLFDEPCSSLDPGAAATVEALIKSLRGKYTVVVVTHNLAQARRVADDVAFFWVKENVGRLIEVGATEQMFTAPNDPLTLAYVTGAAG